MTFVHRPLVTFGLLLALAAAAPVVRAAPPATGRPGPSPVTAAIAALQKEYQTAMNEKKGEGLREKSDYFAENKPEGLTPEAILASLEKRIGADVRAEAYVKWQLLSGVDGKFPDALKPRVLRVYRSAPVPKDHPGRNQAYLNQQLFKIGIRNADAETGINQEIATAIETYRVDVEPILAYRDELYARLPDGFDTLAAGVEDTYARVSHGAPASEFWKTVSGQIRTWALTASDANQMQLMANAILKLNAYVADAANKPYYRVIWDSNAGLKWQSQGTIDQEGRYVGELGEWIEERAKNPAAEGGIGGLQFKESDNGKKPGKRK